VRLWEGQGPSEWTSGDPCPCPTALISLPFKLLLFVLVDGWTLIAGSLRGSFTL
jgi:hypothetical protein